MAVKSYRELVAWQKGMETVEAVYRLSRCFPKDEVFGLTIQIRRAAISIPSNIAEGQGRGAGREFAHHLRIANGSRQEVETQTLLAIQLGYIDDPKAEAVMTLCDEVGRLIAGLLRSLQLATDN